MKPSEATLRSELEARLRFETLLADLSARFINLPAAEVDREIGAAQRQVCEQLGLDLSSLWQWSEGAQHYITLSHLYRPLGGPPLPERVDGQELFPWVLGRLQAGHVVALSSTEQMPPEAARDQELYRYYGIKSSLSFPLSAGGEPLIGALSFNTMRQEWHWSEDLTQRLQLVAQIFANALARKTADEALRRSEERFRNIAVNLPGVVYQFYARDDGTRGMVYVDGRVAEMCGLSAEPLDTFFERFVACIDAEDREPFVASVERSIRAMEPWEREFRFIKPTGEDVYLRGGSLPQRVRNEIVFSGVLCDVTDLKRAEVQRHRHRQELAHVNRVSALGELAGSLAHELNQPLTAILSNAQAASRFLVQTPADLAEVGDILIDIAAEGRRAGEIIRRMRTMLKKDQTRQERVDLNEIISGALSLMRSDLIARNVAVTSRLTPQPPAVQGDSVQLTQVLLNLVNNACDAMTETPAPARQLTISTARLNEGLLQVTVSDGGIGIPADKLEQVFQPFYTSKPQGLGMGLPISRSIIQAHGGQLWAEPNPAGGASLRFTLPADGTPACPGSAIGCSCEAP